jgi:hypothetical protein
MVMKKIIAACLLALFVNLHAHVFAVESVNVRKGLVIPITLNTVQTSKNTVVGEKIAGTIDKDVRINNAVVFQRGDKAVLNVADARKARFWGNPGEMLIINGRIYDANGDEHTIEYYSKIVGEEKTWPKVLGVVSLFFLFPLALFGFVKGGDAKVMSAPIDVSLRDGFEFVPGL